jgi:hypothetical protein
MGFLLKGVVKKYVLRDLNDIKAAVEQKRTWTIIGAGSGRGT